MTVLILPIHARPTPGYVTRVSTQPHRHPHPHGAALRGRWPKCPAMKAI